MDCVLLKDNTRALVASLGREISSRAFVCVLQGPRIVACVIIVSYSAPNLTPLSHIVAKWVAIFVWTLEVPVSNLVPDACYSD
jgi:hypothetical protein